MFTLYYFGLRSKAVFKSLMFNCRSTSKCSQYVKPAETQLFFLRKAQFFVLVICVFNFRALFDSP